LNVTHVVILAAGQGTRMRSAVPKVLHRAGGLALIDHVIRTAGSVSPDTMTVVTGYAGAEVRRYLSKYPKLETAVQEPQLGTAHALQQVEPLLTGRSGTLVLLSGDVPLLSGGTLVNLVNRHMAAGAAATVLTATVDRPYGYGRIVRSQDRIAKIVEERDASPAERAIKEINAGIYAFDLAPLFDALRSIASQNAQGEFYLTDLVGIYRRRGLVVETAAAQAADEIRGVNSRAELGEVARLVRHKKNEELMASGVTLVDPATTYIDADVTVGADTVIHPNVFLEGHTSIGAASEIRPNVCIQNSRVGDRVTIKSFCVLDGATVGDDAVLGPFAHIRPESEIGKGAKVGNFVELKKTVLGAQSKANHLSYLGDATIGANVNVGAGTITCNYDGVSKHSTVIEDGAFIGSDTQLIAPVTVGAGAYVGAGSSITENVPSGALGIARARQSNVEGWAARKAAEKKG
jgi:bifunctional UDP-N-acetylglucosamine pyrophosphorylase/glucosamine-1-phosphate N-acetyltransferase